MRRATYSLLVATAAFCAASAARSEIVPEDRNEAEFVVTGVVRGVYVRDEKEYHNYIVELAVEEVARGKGVELGDTFYVSCFKRKLSAPRQPSPSGHRLIPKEGQRVKAFVKDSKGRHNAIYPQGFDEALPAAEK